MLDLLYQLTHWETLLSLFVSIAVFFTVMGFLSFRSEGEILSERMKSLMDEHKALRLSERKKLQEGGTLRQEEANSYLKDFVERFNLIGALDTDEAKTLLLQAGRRSQSALVLFLFFRFAVPIFLLIGALLYFLFVDDFDLSFNGKLLSLTFLTVLGFFLPKLVVSKMVAARQGLLNSAFPDALDLLLICVESGMSIEAALRRVSNEIGARSIEVAEELALTTAELSYLSERRKAYENLTKRTGLNMIKAFSTTLMQSEKYGTPLTQALHTLGKELRQKQMHAAEKKAAGLGPKLTVPMIVFFLPGLFVVILAPSVIKVLEVIG